MSITSALIIGGGIAGPVAATALHIAGIDARVYEAYPGPAYTIGSGLGFAPNGLAALDVIGAGDAVRAVALPIRNPTMSFGHKMVPLPSLADAEPQQLVDRCDLHAALHDHAVAAGVPFEYNKRLVGVDEQGDGVTARFADGTHATADILVGADGIKSLVRTLVDRHAPDAKFTGLLGFGGIAEISHEVPPNTMVFAFGKRAYYLYWAMPDGRVGWGANLPHDRYLSGTQAQAIGREQWLRTLRDTYAGDIPGGELTRKTDPADLAIIGGLHIMPPVPHWYRDRLVLVGDAVHAPSNSTGQGASLAIESAIQLARCLRDIDDPTKAFATYERMRRPRVEAIAARGAKINNAKSPGPIMRRIMPILLPLMFRAGPVQKSTSQEQRYRIDWDAPVTTRPESALA